MTLRTYCLLAVLAICLVSARARGQEGPGARPPAPGAAALTPAEKKYADLAKSKDRVIKATAERYLNLVKFQEWGGASGKTQMAKYVSHDADLTKVKLSIATGTGKARVTKEFDVDVEKLNKTCQARVKQIDVLQKRLDDLAAADAAKTNGAGGHGAEGPAAAPVAGPEATPAAPAAATPEAAAAPAVDPSASEPDPLGFAELPPVAPGAAGPGAAGPMGPGFAPPGDPANPTPAPAPTKSGGAAEKKPWRTDLTAFAASIKAGTDPSGKPMVDWGDLRELREMNEIIVAQRSPEPPARSPEAETPVAISERLGDMHWQIVVDKVDEAPGGLVVPTFHPVELAKPVELRIMLDDAEDAQKWAKLAPGSTASVTARLSISEPYKITAKVKLAGAK